MRGSYGDTGVSVDRTQGQIRALLQKHGIGGVHFGEDWGRHLIWFSFFKMKPLDNPGPEADDPKQVPVTVKMQIPIWRDPAKWHRTSQALREQRQRQVWRALFHYLKSQLDAVEFGLRSFEDAFMSDIALQDGKSVGDHVRSMLASDRLALPTPAREE